MCNNGMRLPIYYDTYYIRYYIIKILTIYIAVHRNVKVPVEILYYCI